MDDEIRSILHSHFHTTGWTIVKPKDGQQKASFVAHHSQQSVFIKFDVPIAALQRLGEIGVAPRVLASGIAADQPYIIQEYIAGSYPDWRWFASHLPELAAFTRRYHHDQPLTSLLAANTITSYQEHIAQDLATLEKQFHTLQAGELHTPEITSALEKLKSQANHLQPLHPVPLVPVHPDPNTKNMLLFADRLLMVDWDDIQLSDPLRDVGLLLWWYVSKDQWPLFFQMYGLQIDDNLIERIFWWAARTSFAIALWHVEHHYDCRAFLQDFLAAVNMDSNPHAVFEPT